MLDVDPLKFYGRNIIIEKINESLINNVYKKYLNIGDFMDSVCKNTN